MKSGDVCPKCGKARLRCESSHDRGADYHQYLKCHECGYRHTAIVPSSTIRKRKLQTTN